MKPMMTPSSLTPLNQWIVKLPHNHQELLQLLITYITTNFTITKYTSGCDRPYFNFRVHQN